MTQLFAVGIAFAVGFATPAAGQGAASLPPEIAVAAPTSAALARTLAPAELMIPLEIDVGRKALLALPSMNEDAKTLETEYPGIWEAVWKAIEPQIRQYVEEDFPRFWSKLENLYSSRLTEREAQAILFFYRSPTGQKMLRTMLTGVDPAPLIAGIANSEDSTISAEQMRSATDTARLRVLQSLGPADQEQLKALMGSISLDKFRSIGAETQRLTLEWVNEDDPAFDAKVDPLVEAAMEKYIAERSRRR